jgi:hypothetical protein
MEKMTMWEWVSWGGKEMGTGAVKSLGAAPISFAVNYGLSEWLGNAETKRLDEIQNQLKNITNQLETGFKQIDERLGALEQEFGEGLREILLNIQEQIVNQYIIDIDHWFNQMKTGIDWDEVKKPEKREEAEEALNKVCQNMRDSLLNKQVRLLVGQYKMKGEKPDSRKLLADALGFETWMDHVLLKILEGVLVVEESFRQQGAGQLGLKWHKNFWETGLKPVLNEYLFSVEALVLGYLNCLALNPKLPHPEPWRDVMGIVHYIFKRSDLFVLGIAHAFSGGSLPANLLCGRAIGPKEVLDQVEKRVSGLQKLAAAALNPNQVPFAAGLNPNLASVVAAAMNPSSAPFAPAERFLHEEADSISWPNFKQDSGKRVLLARDSPQHVMILRYRLTGFPEKIANSNDKDGKAAPTPGSAEALLRGTPSIDSLGYPAIWDKCFSLLADTWGPTNPQESSAIKKSGTSVPKPEIQCRAETVFALPMLQAYYCAPAESEAPFCITSCYPAAWQAQLPDANPFWDDRRAIEGERKLEKILVHPGWFYHGNMIEEPYARLFRYEGPGAKDAEIQVLLVIWAQIEIQGYDTDYHLKIDLVKTKDENKAGLESVPLVKEIGGVHMPYRDKWRSVSYPHPCEFSQASLKLSPGDYVWLRAGASIWWPHWGEDGSALHSAKENMSVKLQYRILDLQIMWA